MPDPHEFDSSLIWGRRASGWQACAALTSLHGRVPNVQSAIRPMLVSAAICLNPQSAMRNMQTRFRRSNLELRGARSDLEFDPRSS
eukprot:9205724-Alexandrium_andersonii.AAC.1